MQKHSLLKFTYIYFFFFMNTNSVLMCLQQVDSICWHHLFKTVNIIGFGELEEKEKKECWTVSGYLELVWATVATAIWKLEVINKSIIK